MSYNPPSDDQNAGGADGGQQTAQSLTNGAVLTCSRRPTHFESLKVKKHGYAVIEADPEDKNGKDETYYLIVINWNNALDVTLADIVKADPNIEIPEQEQRIWIISSEAPISKMFLAGKLAQPAND